MNFINENITHITIICGAIVAVFGIVTKFTKTSFDVFSWRSNLFFKTKITHLLKFSRIVAPEQRPFYRRLVDQRIFNYVAKSPVRWPIALLIQKAFIEGAISEYEIRACASHFRLNEKEGCLYVKIDKFMVWFYRGGLVVFAICMVAVILITPSIGKALQYIPLSTKNAWTVLVVFLFDIGFFLVGFYIFAQSLTYLLIIRGVAKRLEKKRIKADEKM